MPETPKITSPVKHQTADNTLYMTCTIGLFRAVIDYCRQRQLPIAEILTEAGLTEAELENVDQRIPIESHQRALETAKRLSADDAFGLHFGEDVKPGHYGVVGMVAMSCSKAGELMDLHLRYQSLIADGVTVEYQHLPQGVELRFQPKADFMVNNRLHEESTFSSWITMARWITGLKDHYPLRVNFTSEAPADCSEHHRILGPNIYWQQAVASAVFDHALLDSPLPQSNPALRAALETQAQKQLLARGGSHYDPLLQQVQGFIAKNLADGTLDIEQLATELNTSTRALQRKLSDLDSSFSQVLDQTRQDLAINYMHQAHISLTEIAFLLGFSEQSAFNRAFKRWTGLAPSKYRKQKS